ncbi:MAG: DNA polymerase III subunit alpha, partial [Cucumibacter sp.]
AIAEGSVVAQTQRRRLTPDHYFKTRTEIAEAFQDLPEALDSTVEIARRVSFRPLTRKPILPVFTAGGEAVDESAELARQARSGLDSRLAKMGLAPGTTRPQYDERLEFELGVISSMHYAGYFLIVADFIQWAKARGIPVGPGRGSGGGSLVAYALTITDPDPLRYNLVFERFLNPERVSMPDFDIDFCQERRGEVIAYVQEKYGADHVAQIITFGTLQARAVLRDVGRVLQMPYSQVDRICKLVPVNPANPITLAQAIEQEPRLKAMRDEDETVAELLEIGNKLEGLYRHASTHAAGIVIGDRPLQELVPLYRDPRSDMPVTQYSLKWVEPAGLVKFDFLGLKTLTVIDHAVAMINASGGSLDISEIPLDDPETFGLYQRAETVGIFQVEGAGMRRALVNLKPDRFEDIVAIVALYRPGPMDSIESYCTRKHGREEPDYLHEKLKPVLEETYGIIVYQEHVMQIAQILAGFSLGEADVLRWAMGKKIKAKMAKQHTRFIEGALANGVTKARAETIFELISKFASYGFPKAHAVTYAIVSYQTAWLKVHHPREFLAASMTLDMSNTDKLNDFKREAERLGIVIEPPCVNRSEVSFTVGEKRIHFALCAVKGIGRQVAEHIVAVRGDRAFRDLADFAARIDPKIVGKRTLETLVNAGAFDALVKRREQAFASVDAIVAEAQRASSGRADGMFELFATGAPEPIRLNDTVEPWPLAERLAREYAAIGFYLSAHPLDAYKSLFADMRVQSWAEFERAVKAGVGAGRLAGTVTSREDRRTRRGSAMAILTFSDPSGTYECFAFSDTLVQFGELIETGRSAIIEVEAEARPDGVRMTLIRAQAIEAAAEKLSRRLTIFAGDEKCLPHVRARLERGGEGVVSLVLIREAGEREYEIELPGGYRVSPELASAIRGLPGVTDARLS